MPPTATLEPPSPAAYTAAKFKSDLKPIWCPGCGDFGVVTGMQRMIWFAFVVPMVVPLVT